MKISKPASVHMLNKGNNIQSFSLSPMELEQAKKEVVKDLNHQLEKGLRQNKLISVLLIET